METNSKKASWQGQIVSIQPRIRYAYGEPEIFPFWQQCVSVKTAVSATPRIDRPLRQMQVLKSDQLISPLPMPGTPAILP